jgi:hypothetical protein
MDSQRALRMLPGIVLAVSLFSSWHASAADASPLSSRYSSWAGGKSNADALVKGLRDGTPITLATTAPDRTVSLAGFTPPGRMSEEEVAAMLANARSTLSRVGIRQPTAEQIQAALIGGEVALPGGGTRLVQGTLRTASAPVVATR